MNLSLFSQKVRSFVSERYLGIDTTGAVDPTVKWGVHYTPLPYHIISRILTRLELERSDIFVDIGCGKGRVVCCACRLPVRRVVGIEVNQDLLKQADSNVAHMRGPKASFEPIPLPAEAYDYPDATAIYLYNPFDRPIMDQVFQKLTQSYLRNPRRIRVAYANCVHEEPLRQTGWLKKQDEWPAREFPGFGCPISFWGTANIPASAETSR